MESLALLAAVIGLVVLTSGPLSVAAFIACYPYTAGILGALATIIGIWWAYSVRGQTALIALASAAMGVWSLLQAWRHDTAQ